MKILTSLLAVILLVQLEASTSAKPPMTWDALLKEAHRLERLKDRRQHLKAATLLMKAYRMAPHKLRSLVAAANACSIRASHSKKGREIAKWGKRGWGYAKQMIKRWPKRAEGYFWASVLIGQYARGGGVWVAITQGLAGKIEKMAQKSYQLNRRLYDGAAQRVLGRYYYRLPWPMRKLKRSLHFLRDAYQLAPHHIDNQRYLADTLWALGKKREAIALYRCCAKRRNDPTSAADAARKCHQWLKKHKIE